MDYGDIMNPAIMTYELAEEIGKFHQEIQNFNRIGNLALLTILIYFLFKIVVATQKQGR